MRVQSFKNGVRLSCSQMELIQLRMALSDRCSDLGQILSGSENPDALEMISLHLDMCRKMYEEMLRL